MPVRLRRRTLLWLLPLVLWRLLLPAGFMPGSASAGSPLVICSMHHPADAAGGEQPGGGGTDRAHAAKVCPFAVAGVAAPIPAMALSAAGFQPSEPALTLAKAQRRATPGPARHLPSRAPPPTFLV